MLITMAYSFNNVAFGISCEGTIECTRLHLAFNPFFSLFLLFLIMILLFLRRRQSLRKFTDMGLYTLILVYIFLASGIEGVIILLGVVILAVSLKNIATKIRKSPGTSLGQPLTLRSFWGKPLLIAGTVTAFFIMLIYYILVS